MAKATKTKTEGQTAVAAIPAPSFTITADSEFGMDCMCALAHEADISRNLNPEAKATIMAKVREFELYEEAVRTQGQ